MIRTVGDLLRALIASERKKMDKLCVVDHPSIIGDMYEGLAREVTERALSPLADLRVVEGKIRNSKGEFSRQIDAMVVDGEGERLPHTDHWIYPVEQVVAVMEVKKTLYKKDLADALDLMADFSGRIAEPKAIPNNLLRDAWRSIHGSELPTRESLGRLTEQEQMLYRFLVVEAVQPVRIVLGFDGYRTERGLREGLVSALKDRKGVQGFGPMALPSLVLARESSLFKLNGMPFAGPFLADRGVWHFYGSRGVRPIHMLLEMLWTRLNYYYGAPSSIFGEDLELDAVNLLLVGKIVTVDSRQGWAIDIVDLSDDELANGPLSQPWQPAVLSSAAFVVMNQLCADEDVSLDDDDLRQFAEEKSGSLDALVAELLATRLVYIDDRNLRLLTDGCACVIVPDLGFVAGENKSGRLERWLFKHMAQRKRETADPC